MKPSLLIVEDDASLSEMLALHFEEQGFRIHSAVTCADALELARSARPDLILLDQQLPDGLGNELIPELRSLSPESRIIMMTGVHDLELAIQAIQDGASDRCPPWRAKRRRVVPGSREATRDTRRAEGAKGDPKGASERGVQSYGRPVCSRNELAMLWRNAG